MQCIGIADYYYYTRTSLKPFDQTSKVHVRNCLKRVNASHASPNRARLKENRIRHLNIEGIRSTDIHAVHNSEKSLK